MAPFPDVDATRWRDIGVEVMGTKPKRWVESPDDDPSWWLFKQATYNRDSDGQQYRKGDDWAEKVAAELGRELGVPCAHVELAHRGEVAGVLSRNLVPRGQLTHGNELLVSIDPGYPASDEHRHVPDYTVAAAIEVLSAFDPPPNALLTPPGLTMDARAVFAGYLVLDAWIGNTDRHHQNWGIVKPLGISERPALVASFDHSSSLGFLLSDAERASRLTTSDASYSVEAYASRAKTPFGDADSPRHAARKALELVGNQVRDYWFDRLAAAAPQEATVLANVPDHRISQEARDFAARLLQANRSVLLD